MEDIVRFLVLVLLFVLTFFLGAYLGFYTGAQQHFKGEIVCQDLFDGTVKCVGKKNVKS